MRGFVRLRSRDIQQRPTPRLRGQAYDKSGLNPPAYLEYSLPNYCFCY